MGYCSDNELLVFGVALNKPLLSKPYFDTFFPASVIKTAVSV